jgi:Ribonuclease G/E
MQAGQVVIQLHESPGEHRIAVLRDGALTEFHIDRPAAPDGLGDSHMARVITRIPAMAGSFLALHDAEAFLPDTAGGARLTAGDWVAVRVIRAAQGGKGPRVAALPPGTAPEPAGPARLLQRGPTACEELAQAYPGAALIRQPFTDTLESAIDALAEPDAMLTGGLRVLFTVTPALTSIDLDGAGSSAARDAKAVSQIAANTAALPDLVRQIVLRNFAGAILVDFAGMPSRKRQTLGPALQAALAQDRLQPRLAGFTPLGFAEIERRRLRPPLHEKLATPYGQGLAALRQAAAEIRAAPARRLALRANPSVIAALENDAAACATLARGAAYPLVLRRDTSLFRTWVIEDAYG